MNRTEELLFQELNILIDEKNSLALEVEVLPSGSIQEKRIKNRLYYYRQYREGKSVKSIFVPEDKIDALREQIRTRKEKTARINELDKEIKQLSRALGGLVYTIAGFCDYKPVKNVDYKVYTHFMSWLAHELKRLGKEEFIKQYSVIRERGIKARYQRGLINYLSGQQDKYRNSPNIVLDPFTYQMYFVYKDRSILRESFKKAVPEFLQQGLLITDIQEAVDGAFD